MLGWLINIALLEDRFILILFNLLKFGIIRTNSDKFSGFSIVLGIYKMELQVNLSLIKNRIITLKSYESGRA